MKRFHVHVKVDDLARSIHFYSNLFGQQPAVVKDDYAKWMLEDPRLNFAISHHSGAQAGIEHLGFQLESAEELNAMTDALKAADVAVLDERGTTCCYAQSDKGWVHDPTGIAWETFVTHGSATTYGGVPTEATSAAMCCAPPEAVAVSASIPVARSSKPKVNKGEPLACAPGSGCC
jgi:catechol 2,3-dioxygenase-like lactoylglutathione lyase family enzyme